MVNPRLEGIKYKIAALMEGDDLSIIFDEMKRKLAMEIINTDPDDVSMRNEKYWLVRSIKTLEKEFQGYVNDISRLEEDK
ncbi:MAG: hypothetical protein ACRC6V_02495 [Bacteroidales bacterium]